MNINEELKIIEPTKTNFNLKYKGNYDKNKIASNIILSANQAIKDGFKLNNMSWNVKFDEKTKSFIYSESYYNWISILGSILLYSNFKLKFGNLKSKTEIVADVLGVYYDWIKGFCYGIDGRYEGSIKSIKNRKSERGQQCRDGIEIGSLLKFGYGVDRLINFSYKKTIENNFNTHTWIDIEENKILTSLGVIRNNKINQCKECKLFGGKIWNIFDEKEGYFISKDLHGYKNQIYPREIYNLSCKETLIKNIIE